MQGKVTIILAIAFLIGGVGGYSIGIHRGAARGVDALAGPAQDDGQSQVRVRIDETQMRWTYANAFRTSPTPEELLMDLGVNTVVPSAHEQGQAEILFEVNNRIVMNHYTAKRLAIALSGLIAQHEREFGELELDASKRRKAK